MTGCNAVVVEVLWAEQNATSVKCFISEHRRCRRVVYWGSGRERKRGSAGYDQRREVYLCAKPHFSKEWWTLMMVKRRTGVDAQHTHTHRAWTYQRKWNRFSMPLFWTVLSLSIKQWYIFQKYTVSIPQPYNLPYLAINACGSLYYVQKACPSYTRA